MAHHEYEWTWMDCSLTLKRTNKINQNHIYQILESEYIIEVEGEQAETQLNIDILMEKRINFEENSGFSWHKSWNIPYMEIKISKRDLSSIKTQLAVSKIYCEMTSGYPIRKNVQFFLQEVVLDGQTRKQFGINGIAKFNNLKFSETSFSHERNKFCLILIIFAKNQDKTKAILKSFISMPIYVDSRKQARKKNPLNKFIFQIIGKQDFKQDLQKRHRSKKIIKHKVKSKKVVQTLDDKNEQQKSPVKYKIQYSLDGFLKYYSSANIRNKVKHPFYFVYHFYPLLSLYYDTQTHASPIQLLKELEKPVNLKHDSKKVLMIALLFEHQDNQEFREEMRRRFLVLFENWKFFFIDVIVDDKNDEKNRQYQKKWVEIDRQELFTCYTKYFDDFERRQFQEQEQNSEQSKSVLQKQDQNQINRKYQHFQLHQMINIQQAFIHHHNPRKSEHINYVKIQVDSSQNQ